MIENPYPAIENDYVAGRFQAALELIRKFQPHRFRHLQRDVCQFWITRYPTRGVWFHQHCTILTEITFLNRASVHSEAEVAACILHEGIHARVAQMGRRLGFRREWARADEERVCRRAEVLFGSTLPAEIGDAVLERAAPTLEADVENDDVAPVIDWRQAHLNKYISDLEEMQIPHWLRAPLVRWAQFRLRRHSAA